MNSNFRVILDPPVNEWRKFVQQNPAGNIFQTPEMVQVYDSTKHHQVKVFACLNPESHINALIIAVLVDIFNGPFAKYSRRCILYGGILPCITRNNGQLVELLSSVDKLAKSCSLFTEIRNIHDLNSFKKDVLSCGYRYYDYINYLIPLDRDPQEIFKEFSRTRRQNIRKLQKLEITVREVHSFEEAMRVYNIIKETYKRIHVPLADATLFKATYNILKPAGIAKFYMATLESDEIAAAVTLIHKKTLYIWYMGTRKDYLKITPASMIAWYLIKWGSENGYKILDWLGAGRPNDHYGVGEFKKRFGGIEVNYGRFEKIYNDHLYKLCERAYKYYRVFV